MFLNSDMLSINSFVTDCRNTSAIYCWQDFLRIANITIWQNFSIWFDFYLVNYKSKWRFREIFLAILENLNFKIYLEIKSTNWDSGMASNSSPGMRSLKCLRAKVLAFCWRSRQLWASAKLWMPKKKVW